MWVEKLSNGKFRYAERYLDKKTGKKKRVSVTLNSNSKQAQNQAVKLLNEKINNASMHPTHDMTVREALDLYEAFKTPYWEKISLASFRAYVNNHIKPLNVYHYLLSQLTLSDVQTIADRMQFELNLSSNYTKKVVKALRSACNHAINYHDVACNVNFRLVVFKEKLKPSEIKDGYIASVNVKNMVQDLRNKLPELYADFAEAQLLSGMRFGELAALTEEDWQNNQININKSIDTYDKRRVKGPKNTQSVRIIESSDRLNEIFQRRIAINTLLFGENSSLIFANSNNRPMLRYYMNRQLKKVDPRLTTHLLRHTHISLLSEKGLPLKYIMARVGHTKPETTLKIYTHVTENIKREGAKALNNLF